MTTAGQRKRWRRIQAVVAFLVLVMAACVVVPSVAVADQATGLEALRDANDAFDEEDFEAAYDNYEKAYEILGVEMIEYRLGQTAHAMGWAERAIMHYERYREIGDDEEFLSRIDEALPDLREQIQVTLEVRSEPEGAKLTVLEPAGEFEEKQTPVTLTMQPGEVELTLELEGYHPELLERNLEPGEEFVWDPTLVDESEEQPVAELELDEPKAEEPPALAELQEFDDVDEGESSLAMWGWTTTGVGVSLLAFGGVMSLFQSRTTDQVNELDRASAGAQTQSFEERQSLRREQEALRDDAHTYYRVSTGAFIAGGVLTAAGAGLLLHGMMGSDSGSEAEEGLSIRGGFSSDGGLISIGGRF